MLEQAVGQTDIQRLMLQTNYIWRSPVNSIKIDGCGSLVTASFMKTKVILSKYLQK